MVWLLIWVEFLDVRGEVVQKIIGQMFWVPETSAWHFSSVSPTYSREWNIECGIDCSGQDSRVQHGGNQRLVSWQMKISCKSDSPLFGYLPESI